MMYLIIILGAVGVIYSIILHEVAHGLVAKYLGDDTASVMGRLTLNPIAHIDVWGTIILPLILIFLRLPVFGWAKPVPVNPNKMEKPSSDFFITALAGPISNFLIALVLGSFVRFIGVPSGIMGLILFLVEINLALMIFNLIPIPPLDGSKVLGLFLPMETMVFLQQFGMFILFALIIFSSSIPIIPYIINHVVGFFFSLLTGQTMGI